MDALIQSCQELVAHKGAIILGFLAVFLGAGAILPFAKLHPHRLRHNAATSLRKKFGVELARIILGHATAFTTEIYAEVDRQQAMEIVGRVG